MCWKYSTSEISYIYASIMGGQGVHNIPARIIWGRGESKYILTKVKLLDQ